MRCETSLFTIHRSDASCRVIIYTHHVVNSGGGQLTRALEIGALDTGAVRRVAVDAILRHSSGMWRVTSERARSTSRSALLTYPAKATRRDLCSKQNGNCANVFPKLSAALTCSTSIGSRPSLDRKKTSGTHSAPTFAGDRRKPIRGIEFVQTIQVLTYTSNAPTSSLPRRQSEQRQQRNGKHLSHTRPPRACCSFHGACFLTRWTKNAFCVEFLHGRQIGDTWKARNCKTKQQTHAAFSASTTRVAQPVTGR